MYTVPDQSGRTAIVTGANGGLGQEAAARLAAAGARVVLAVRSLERGEKARAEIQSRVGPSDLEVRELDLADLASIQRFAGTLLAEGRPVDLLIHNAGVMSVPDLTLTVDGLELQMAANALGPVALTTRLLPLLLAAPGARVTTMSSTAALAGRVDPEHLARPRRYRAFSAYAASKLADLLLTRHLANVAGQRGWDLRSTSAHPGLTRTNLFSAGASLGRDGTRHALPSPLNHLVPYQDVSAGVEPMLLAATDPQAGNGSYWGPDGWFEIAGEASPARRPRAARNDDLAARFWTAAEELTGVSLLDVSTK